MCKCVWSLPVKWSHAAGAVVPLSGPRTVQCCPVHLSTVWCHHGKCLYNLPHLCGPGTAYIHKHIGIVFKCISSVYTSLSTKRHYLMWHSLVCFLPDKGLVMKVPDSNISITTAWEADLGVWADRQRIAGWGRRGELSFDTRSLRG